LEGKEKDCFKREGKTNQLIKGVARTQVQGKAVAKPAKWKTPKKKSNERRNPGSWEREKKGRKNAPAEESQEHLKELPF